MCFTNMKSVGSFATQYFEDHLISSTANNCKRETFASKALFTWKLLQSREHNISKDWRLSKVSENVPIPCTYGSHLQQNHREKKLRLSKNHMKSKASLTCRTRRKMGHRFILHTEATSKRREIQEMPISYQS